MTWHLHAASSSSGSDFFLRHNERNRLVFTLIHCPWRVVALAVGSTIVGVALKPGRRRRLGALLAALRMAPQALRKRRAVDRRALVPRRVLARDLVRDRG